MALSPDQIGPCAQCGYQIARDEFAIGNECVCVCVQRSFERPTVNYGAGPIYGMEHQMKHTADDQWWEGCSHEHYEHHSLCHTQFAYFNRNTIINSAQCCNKFARERENAYSHFIHKFGIQMIHLHAFTSTFMEIIAPLPLSTYFAFFYSIPMRWLAASGHWMQLSLFGLTIINQWRAYDAA